jgi:hypothetical protein
MGLLGGAVAAEALLRPLAVPAQQGERVRRVGVLMHLAEPDREGQDRFGAFLQELSVPVLLAASRSPAAT